MNKPRMHFTNPYLLDPTNPVTVNLIGAGGTGSQVLHKLLAIHHCLKAFNHPGLHVRLFDEDIVTDANPGRQLFSEAEIGLKKAVALILRINRFEGTSWKAVPYNFSEERGEYIKACAAANIFITCVDKIGARFEIAGLIKQIKKRNARMRDEPYYWLDCGNSEHTGQVILATVGKCKQPASDIYTTVEELPFITDEFKDVLLEQQKTESDQPSCSLADALTKQDLFINPDIANDCSALLWGLFRYGMTENRGVFSDIKNFKRQPLKV